MYIALKPCQFGMNHHYYIGDIIPDGVVSPDAVKRLKNAGVIAQHPETGTEQADTVNITVHTDEGDAVFTPTVAGLQDVFDVLTGKVSDADAIISRMTDGYALILLHMAESRKTVKAAAEERGKALAGGEP